MATIDSVASTISGAIAGANNNVTSALNMLSGQLMATRVANTPNAGVPVLTALQRSSSDAASFAAMEAILTALRADLNAITEDAAVVTSIPAYGATENAIWSETFWTNLKSTLSTLLSVTSSTSVDEAIVALTSNTTAVQNAMYATDLERKQQALRDAHSAANSAVGARGFTYPNSMTTALKLAAQQQYMFDRTQVARDLIKQIFEWAKTSEQFVIGKQIEAHAADVEFNLQYRRMAEAAFANEAQRIFNKYQKEVELKLLAVEKAIAGYRIAYEKLKFDDELSLQSVSEQVKAYSINAQQTIANNQTAMNGVVATYTGSLQAAKDAIQAASAVASSSSNSVIGILNT